MIARKLVVFLTSSVIGCGVHTVVADPTISTQQPNIPVLSLSHGLANPMPARAFGSTDSAKTAANQLRSAYQAAVAATQGLTAASSPRRRAAAINGVTIPSVSWISKSQHVSVAPAYKSPPTVQRISATGGDLDVRMRDNGTLRRVGISQGSVRNSLSAIGKDWPAENIARAFLNMNPTLLGIENPVTEFELDSIHVDAQGTQHLRFQQVYAGIPVWGRQLLAEVTGSGDLTSIVGSYSPTPRKIVLNPTVDSATALETARNRYDPLGAGDSRVQGLVIVTDNSPMPNLAWVSEIVVSRIEKWLVLVDAHTSQVLTAVNQVVAENVQGSGVDLFGQSQTLNVWQEGGTHYLIDTSKQMFDAGSIPLDLNSTKGAIYIGDFANQEDSASIVFSLGGPNGTWLADGVSAAASLSSTYDYFLERHGRNSLDGLGGNLYGLVRYGVGLNNAFFDGSTQLMVFGDGDAYAGALDVVAHEMTHGVISTTANLVYQNQSGALNESFADIFGELVEARENGQPDWLLGSRLSSPIRNMADPGSLLSFLGRPYPTRFSDYEFTTQDNGGVHVNSSIVNHAFYLLAEGLPTAVGIDDAANIFYRALTTKLTPLSDFYDARFGLILSAEELFGIGSAQALATAAALDAVEIFDAPTNPLPGSTPGIVGPDSTLFTYWDSGAGAYFLGRLEPDIDPPQGSQLSFGPILGPRASVDGAGEMAIFVNDQNDVCFIATSGGVQESCAGLTGQIASVAMAADGETFGLVLLDSAGNPTNRITVIDFATNSEVEYVLEAPVFDGVSSIQVVQADAMDFTNDSRFLVYDAFNIADFGSSVLGLWSLYAIDLLTGTTFPLTTPTPEFNTAYPSVAQTSDGHLTFDAYDLINNENIVAAADVYAGQIVGLAVTGQNYSIPSYSGDDAAIVFSSEDANVPTGGNLWQVPLGSDRLTPTAGPTLWLQDAVAGSIFRRGTFLEPARVDLEVTYEATVSVGNPIVSFGFRLRNIDQSEATNVTISVARPENASVYALDYPPIGDCEELTDRVVCRIASLSGELASHVTFLLEYYSEDRTMRSAVTVFSDESDIDERNNTAFASADENLLNDAPIVVQALPDRTETEGVPVNFNIAGAFTKPGSGFGGLTYSAAGLPASLSVNATTGDVTGTPTSTDAGNTFAVTATVTDFLGDSASDSFSLTIAAAPPPPPPPPPPTPSGGGGGGGSTGSLMLMLLGFGCVLLRRDQRLRWAGNR